MSQAFYLLFALTEAGSAAQDQHVTGLDGGEICWHKHADFLLAYQELTSTQVTQLFPSDYGAEASSNEQSQLAKVVGEFQTVQFHIARQGPLVSFRFGTMVADLASLWHQLDAKSDDLKTSFDKLRGHEEWGLQILETAASAKSQPTEAQASRETPKSGRDYLRSLSAGKQQEQQTQEARQAFLEQLEAGLMALVSDHVELTTGRVLEDGHVVRANLSLLVPQRFLSDLQQLVDVRDRDAQQHGLSLRLTGPWPPQSFAPIDFSL